MGSHNIRPAFRPEIEGLRAVASLLVAVFHIWLGRVSGGVDVFFVVSSFLITTGLLGQLDRAQHVDFALFWGRLIRRLVPMAYLVLCVVVVAAIIMMPKSRWKDTIEQVGAAAVYMENWLLAYHSVDYLAQHQAVSPVQHFWALSTQGQFYLVWPMLFAAAALASRRAGIALRPLLSSMLLGLLACSLAYSIYLTAVNQPFAYFNTLARTWEFCIGALLAIVLPQLRITPWLRVAMGWAGLLGMLSCGLLFQVSRVFPGYAALWPTLAAVLIITAGTTRSAIGADRLLASQPMVYLGGISYGIYLWHFPILAFSRLYADPHPLSFQAGMAILVASIALAALSTHLFENPIRQGSREVAAPTTRRLSFAMTCVAPLVVSLVAWSGAYLVIKHQHHQVQFKVGHPNYPGAMARSSRFSYHGEPAVEVLPGPFDVTNDHELLVGEGCHSEPEATMPDICRVAGNEGMYTIAVVGGSHSSQWLPALEMIAERSGWQVISFAKSNCPFYFDNEVSEDLVASCEDWNRNVLQALLRLRPDVVFTTSTRYRYADHSEFVPHGYVNAWERLSRANITVVALRDNPDFEFDVSACVELHGPDSPLCALPRNSMLAPISPTRSLSNSLPNVRFIDLSDYFCDATRCPPVIGNILVYRHMNHITATFARTLAPMLREAMEQALHQSPDT